MGCIKLSILDELYKSELKISSPQKELTSNFRCKSACSYSLFGQVISEYRSDWMMDTIPRYLFNAKELDEESGMYYYEQRYYNPKNGTFEGRDLLFEKYFWMSPYAYCANTPVKYIDPDGRSVRVTGDAADEATGTLSTKNITVTRNTDTESKTKSV
jgi:RHS repeat-associated protein